MNYQVGYPGQFMDKKRERPLKEAIVGCILAESKSSEMQDSEYELQYSKIVEYI